MDHHIRGKWSIHGNIHRKSNYKQYMKHLIFCPDIWMFPHLTLTHPQKRATEPLDIFLCVLQHTISLHHFPFYADI